MSQYPEYDTITVEDADKAIDFLLAQRRAANIDNAHRADIDARLAVLAKKGTPRTHTGRGHIRVPVAGRRKE